MAGVMQSGYSEIITVKQYKMAEIKCILQLNNGCGNDGILVQFSTEKDKRGIIGRNVYEGKQRISCHREESGR